MFIGQYSHTLDDKNRLALPARFRADLERGLALTAGTDKYLLAYALPEFEKLAEKVDALQLIGQEAATLRRLLCLARASMCRFGSSTPRKNSHDERFLRKARNA